MREVQLEREDFHMKQTESSEFLKNFEGSESSEVVAEMVNLIEAEVTKYHDSVKRKRADFFKVTTGLEISEVAFIGLKSLVVTMVSTSAMSVVSLAGHIGESLLKANGRAEDVFSVEPDIVSEKVSSGIKLLDLVINALPDTYFRRSCERLNATKVQWTIEVGKGFEDLCSKHKDIFGTLSRRMVPLVCLPDDWEGMTGGGYLSDLAKKVVPLVKRSPKHVLPEGDTVFKAINHLQKTPYRVNKKIFNLCAKLEDIKPVKMKKVFPKDVGKFTEEYPLVEEDSYIWEKVEGLKVDKKTGKEKKATVMVHTDEESSAKRKAFFKWIAQKDLHKKRTTARKSIHRSYRHTLNLAESLSGFESIYWGYQLDRRGRVYPSAMTGINLQGSDYQKAVVEFAVGLPIGSEDGVYAVKKTLCNHWGKDSGNGVKTDKLTRQQGEAWTEKSSDWIVECARAPLKNIEWMDADKPLQFLTACYEWTAWLKYSAKNKDYGFISHLCDPNDASCSGAQILSAMTRDDIGAMHTNLKDMEVQDLYMACADKVTENLLKAIKGNSEYNDVAQDWLGRKNVIDAIVRVVAGEEDEILTEESQKLILSANEKGLSPDEIYSEVFLQLSTPEMQRMSLIIRNLVKQPVMVKFYSGTIYGNISYCNEFIIENEWEEHFRSESIGSVAAFIGDLIYHSINEVIKGAGQVMEYFVYCAKILGGLNLPVKWITPIGFHAQTKKLAEKSVKIKVPFGPEQKVSQFTVKVAVKIATDSGWEYKLDTKKICSGIAPDIVHSLDASLIMAVSARCAEEGIDHLCMIHDSLGTHVCHSAKFSRIIREEFIKLFKGDYLLSLYKGFRSQLKEEHKDLLQSPEQFGIVRGTYQLEELLTSEFAFH